jgi:hypothetical protein
MEGLQRMEEGEPPPGLGAVMAGPESSPQPRMVRTQGTSDCSELVSGSLQWSYGLFSPRRSFCPYCIGWRRTRRCGGWRRRAASGRASSCLLVWL